MTFTWKDQLATGIKEIDDQHKELIHNISNLLLACNNGKGKEEINNIINYLDSYITEHFKAEERYMNNYNYPNIQDHKSEHEKFVKNFILLKDQFYREGPSSFFALQINQNIVNWLIVHVHKTDKKLAQFLKNKIS